jgi:hypothetical protein
MRERNGKEIIPCKWVGGRKHPKLKGTLDLNTETILTATELEKKGLLNPKPVVLPFWPKGIIHTPKKTKETEKRLKKEYREAKIAAKKYADEYGNSRQRRERKRKEKYNECRINKKVMGEISQNISR